MPDIFQNLIPPQIQGLLTLIFMAITLTMIYYILLKTSPQKVKEEYKTVTVIRCDECDHEENRAFQKGDFVGKILGECSECGKGKKYIALIYSEKIPQTKKET